MASRQNTRKRRHKEVELQSGLILSDELAMPKRMFKDEKSARIDKIREEALNSLGSLECDVVFDEKELCDLHDNLVFCGKDRDHRRFTPALKFTMDSLPEKFRDEDVFDCVEYLKTLTVIIKVGKTSEGRPDGYPFRQLCEVNMPNHNHCGTGSAFIPDKDSTNSNENGYSVYVSTAHHVIYDDFEASHTKIGMYFDDIKDPEKIVWLDGVRLVDVDDAIDRCILECVTHDKNIVKSIEHASNSLRDKEMKLKEKYAKDVEENKLPLMALIVSHPHGCNKQISFGTQVVKKHMRDGGQGVEWTKYFYDAATCRGCSGALVFFLGQGRIGHKDRSITVHTHSGRHTNTLNESGGGLDYVVTHEQGRSDGSQLAI